MDVSPIRIRVGEAYFGLILGVYLAQSLSDENLVISDEHIAYERCDLETTIQRLHVKYNADFLKKIHDQILLEMEA